MQSLLNFIQDSPSPWHAGVEIQKQLKKAGFKELDEKEHFSLKAGGKYFISRGHSSVIAFCVPKNDPVSSTILVSHTDTPALRLKPQGEYVANNTVYWSAQVYGGPLYSSWQNRELGFVR